MLMLNMLNHSPKEKEGRFFCSQKNVNESENRSDKTSFLSGGEFNDIVSSLNLRYLLQVVIINSIPEVPR